MTAFVFWIAVAILVYTYIGYPLALWLLRRKLDRPVKRGAIEPSVSLVIPARNEAHVIAAKIANAVTLNYKPDKLELVIVSDGSTDGTAGTAREALAKWGAESRGRVVEHLRNRGKLSVLNEVVPTLTGEIVVFSDAATMFATNAIRALVRSYADPEVGAAGGVYQVSAAGSAPTGEQEDLYWRYETFLKEHEAAMGSVIGAHGAIYSVRKKLYPFPPADTINDDFVIPLRILQKGYRVAYDRDAVAYEDAREMTGFERRVRIAAGNLEQLPLVRHFIRPYRPLELFYFVSHKLLRIVCPFAMVAAFVLNLSLPDRAIYELIFVTQIAFYALAIAGAAVPLPGVLRLPYYFCMINVAVVAALFYRVVRGRPVAWR